MKNQITLKDARTLANIYNKVLTPQLADYMISQLFKNQF